jgi:hypothetical protein
LAEGPAKGTGKIRVDGQKRRKVRDRLSVRARVRDTGKVRVKGQK